MANYVVPLLSFFFLLLLLLLHNLTLVILRSWSPDQFGEMCAEYDMRSALGECREKKNTNKHRRITRNALQKRFIHARAGVLIIMWIKCNLNYFHVLPVFSLSFRSGFKCDFGNTTLFSENWWRHINHFCWFCYQDQIRSNFSKGRSLVYKLTAYPTRFSESSHWVWDWLFTSKDCWDSISVMFEPP